MTKYFILMLLLILFVFSIGLINATIWYVHPDSSLNTIQAGLDSTSASDTVLVAPGTYSETIAWPSKTGISLMSEFGPEVTVINAEGVGRVITMAQYMTQTTMIDGFTIINGWATGPSPDDYGGGIYCLNTASTIRNNIIRNNSGYSRGGGIYCENSSPHIIGNIIMDNGTSGRGGGICCYDDADALISENYFYNNSAENGGAIDCYIHSDATIEYNQIEGNNATSGGGVFAGWSSNMYNASSCPTIHHNNISGNVTDGLYCNNFYCWVGAQNNWWGHTAGPDSGDTYHGKVNYDPWLRDEIIFDIVVISIESLPDTIIPGSTYIPKITVRNNCNHNYPVSFFTAKCTINGDQDYIRINEHLPQDSTMEVVFTNWRVPSEDSTAYLIRVKVFYAVDAVATNDTISKQFIAQHPTGIEDTEVRFSPSSFALFQNYPNPFNPTTQIEYQLAHNCYVNLIVYNILGHKVKTLVEGFENKGHKTAYWNGTDEFGQKVASGIYFYRLDAGESTQIKKMLLLK
ncbi:MAG: T9SS type A sorting domain-containing protein [Promethearchaeota archaeon]